MKKNFVLLILLSVYQLVISQSRDSGVHQTYLPEIQIVGKSSVNDYQQIPEIVGNTIYAGKKNSLIVMDHLLGNKATNTMRQVLAKVPGIHIWESDGSGIQIGIASRGLSPNRSWEFNVRQNGYDIAADPYGYPEAYYNPQLQSVQRLEVVRGPASLQYGPQIGGLINYILKDGSQLQKPFQFESEQQIGSFGMINSYTAIGGNTKRWNYYAFYDGRRADGFRDNSYYRTGTWMGNLTYKINGSSHLKIEATKWSMLSQQPGGLTDAALEKNPRLSLRGRNWFDLDWTIGALSYQHSWNDRNKWLIRAFAMQGKRNSIGYNPSAGILARDTILSATGQFNARTIDIDHYTNWGMESKWLSEFNIGGTSHTFSAGIRWYQGHTDRWRGGKENGAGNQYTIERQVTSPWTADIDYNTTNAAIYTEQVFRLNPRWILIPGLRLEYLQGEASGTSGLRENIPIPLVARERSRAFLLAGLATEYHFKNLELYASIHQSYRPIQFADLTTPPTSDELDPNLKDSKAWSREMGLRGFLVDGLRLDASVYHLRYQDRIGTIRQQRLDGSFYNFRTNVGASTSAGIETLIEWNLNAKSYTQTGRAWIPFISYAYNHSVYDRLRVVSQSGTTLVESTLEGKKVENAPNHILRTGLEWRHPRWKWVANYSYTSSMYTDANNTEIPTANGQNGLIPAYHILDLSGSYQIHPKWTLKGGVNNLTDEIYFTRRAGGYPGPGALPADGRSIWLALAWSL
jgi:Fe(3+) dicitrate transport protein